jgi:hypothetical protein
MGFLFLQVLLLLVLRLSGQAAKAVAAETSAESFVIIVKTLDVRFASLDQWLGQSHWMNSVTRRIACSTPKTVYKPANAL